jgi:hypothetical protein
MPDAAFRTFFPSFLETGLAFGRSLIAVFWLTSLLAVIGDWETAMTVGGVEILGGLGVVAEEEVVVVTRDILLVVVVGKGVRDKGGEEGNVFVGNVSVVVGATASVF